jgi:CheY-like chemotaxis protein
LIVDDDKNISRLMGILLEKTGRYEVRTETRSVGAHAVVREFRPDLCIFDVDMPGKDGGTLAREVRADPAFAELPIIFLTSLVSPQEAGTKPMVSGGLSLPREIGRYRGPPALHRRDDARHAPGVNRPLEEKASTPHERRKSPPGPDPHDR